MSEEVEEKADEQAEASEAIEGEGKEKNEKSEKSSLDLSEERHRLVALVSGLPLCLFCVLVLLPARYDRTILTEAMREPIAIASLVLVFVWPLVVGIAAFLRAYKGITPSKLLFRVPGIAVGILSFGLSGLLLFAVFLNRGASGEPAVWLVLASTAAASSTLLYGFFRTGFRAFNHLIASIWFLGLGGLSIMASSSKTMFRKSPPALWVFCVVMAMLLPLLAYAFWPRKEKAA